MNIQTLVTFFMWCTIINGVLFFLTVTMFMLAPDFLYRTQSKLFPIPRETFNVVFYSSLGMFKLILLIFNVIPYIALLIIG
jgi:hypothetical protein